MQYSVTIELDTRAPLTEPDLEAVAELGGAAGGHVGQHRLTTTLTDSGDGPGAALANALERVTDLVPGDLVAAEILTLDEADRRLDLPAFPELVGISEIADRLGVTRQRAHALQQHTDFPAPVARLASGPVWRADDLTRFETTWNRRPGRPRNEIAHATGDTAEISVDPVLDAAPADPPSSRKPAPPKRKARRYRSAVS